MALWAKRAPGDSIQRGLSLTTLQLKPEMCGTTTLANTHEDSTNRKVEEHARSPLACAQAKREKSRKVRC